MTVVTAAPPDVRHRTLLKIALPMTLGYLTIPLVGLVSMAAVGQLSDAALTGGVALGAIVTDVVFSTCNFLRSGTTALSAQAVGRGDGDEVGAVLVRALLVAVVIGLAIVVALPLILAVAPAAMASGPRSGAAMVDYLTIRLLGAPLVLGNFALFGWLLGRSRSGLGLVLLTLQNGVSIALSLILVVHAGLGVTGAAIAALAADLTALIVGLAFAGHGVVRGIRLGWARLVDPVALRAMLIVNRDILIRSFVLLGAYGYFARLGAGQGDDVLAANAILENFYMVGGFFLDGVAAAAETFVGQAVGARDRRSFDRAVRLTAGWAAALALCCSLALFGVGALAIDIMTTSATVRATAGSYLVWAALAPLAGVAAFNLDGIYIGATWSRDMRNMMIVSLALFVASAWLLLPLLGNHGLWLAFLIFLGARGVSLGLLLPSRAARTFATPGATGRASPAA